jgi:hypothetical protein
MGFFEWLAAMWVNCDATQSSALIGLKKYILQ